MGIRKRTRTGAVVSGYVNWGGTIVTSSYQPYSSFIEDVVGNYGGENPVRLERYTRSGGLIAGRIDSQVTWFSRPCQWIVGTPAGHLPVSGEMSGFEAAVAGTARGSPYRPDINLPVSILELKDLPRMLFNKPRRKKGSNSIVEDEFGWQPLISDAKKLLTLPSLVNDRMKMLSSMRSAGGLTRRRKAYSGSASLVEPGKLLNGDLLMSVSGTLTTSTRVTKFVSAKWRPMDDLKSLGSEEMANRARALALGLDHRQLVSQGWDAIPWSWLIDWFSNFGDFLSLYSGGLEVAPTNCTVSTKRLTSQATSAHLHSSKVTFSSCHVTHLNWDRTVNVPLLPTFRLPILDNRQTLILASIAFNKR